MEMVDAVIIVHRVVFPEFGYRVNIDVRCTIAKAQLCQGVEVAGLADRIWCFVVGLAIRSVGDACSYKGLKDPVAMVDMDAVSAGISIVAIHVDVRSELSPRTRSTAITQASGRGYREVLSSWTPDAARTTPALFGLCCDGLGLWILPAKETAKAATGTTTSMALCFRLDPACQESPRLEIIQSGDLCLDLRLLPVKGQQGWYTVDAVSQWQAAESTHIRAVHLHFSV